MEQAIRYVMSFYEISRSEAVKYYWDEIEAYMSLLARFEEQ